MSDIRKHVPGGLEITLRTELQKIQGRYDELSDITTEFAEEKNRLDAENKYLLDYIRWKNSDDDFRHFRENAHEEPDEYGFLSLFSSGPP